MSPRHRECIWLLRYSAAEEVECCSIFSRSVLCLVNALACASPHQGPAFTNGQVHFRTTVALCHQRHSGCYQFRSEHSKSAQCSGCTAAPALAVRAQTTTSGSLRPAGNLLGSPYCSLSFFSLSTSFPAFSVPQLAAGGDHARGSHGTAAVSVPRLGTFVHKKDSAICWLLLAPPSCFDTKCHFFFCGHLRVPTFLGCYAHHGAHTHIPSSNAGAVLSISAIHAAGLSMGQPASALVASIY